MYKTKRRKNCYQPIVRGNSISKNKKINKKILKFKPYKNVIENVVTNG